MLPLIQPIVTVDAPAPPNVMSNTDKKNIPPENQLIPAPKPVRIMIMNPLSTLALCAANMQFPTPPSPPAPALECNVQKVTINLNPAEPMSKPKKAKGKMHPSQTRNGHNLCAHRWLKQIKMNGTTDKFGVYYMSLTENQHTAYDKEVTDLSPCKWAAPASTGHKTQEEDWEMDLGEFWGDEADLEQGKESTLCAGKRNTALEAIVSFLFLL
ncbi:hypothetical protein EDB19DRAFT_1914633 [Suillus lakei]|nr:hypothetical protein EDB19DRAFT_1914633 [Suillus lakei]